MSILNTNDLDNVTESKLYPNGTGGYSLKVGKTEKVATLSDYSLKSDEEKAIRAMIIKHFALGYVTMRKPRVELNDLSVIGRDTYDRMSFNTYQPNNGDPLEGDVVNSWKSKAIRPVVRNKVISIAAHATAHLIFPKVFAQNDQCEEDRDAATVMRDLIEWATDQSNYAKHSLYSVIDALVSPCSISYNEYSEVYRKVKREKGADGKWIVEEVCDEDLSGFQTVNVPVNELFIENIYEEDIQKQGWLIWRKVISYSLAEAKYRKYDNFQYVLPGVQTIYNDANDSFYQVYDPNMRQEECEEVIYWNKSLDLKIVMVNGVMMTDADNPNPRNDKRYPFTKFGYELINTKFFYYKSLAFKLQQDAKIVNTLYPMMIDGTYLDVIPAMFNVGGEEIGSDVIIPGAVTTLSDPNADLRSINVGNPNRLRTAQEMLKTLEESLTDTAKDTEMPSHQITAYQMSRIEQQAATNIGLFIQMFSEYVRQYGSLLMGDILQNMTIVDVDKLVDNSELVFKTFLLPEGKGRNKSKRIKFTLDMPKGKLSKEDHLKESYKALEEQGGHEAKSTLYKVNPQVFRNLKFKVSLSPDVLSPMSDEVEKAFMLEEYDRAIANPLLDQEEITKDFLLAAYPKSAKDPDKYIKKADPEQVPGIPPMNTMPQAGNSPLNAINNKLPQSMATKQ